MPSDTRFINKYFDDYPFGEIYYQAIHEKLMAFGFISRIQLRLIEKEKLLTKLISKEKYSEFKREYGFTCILLSDTKKIDSHFNKDDIIYRDGAVALVSLQNQK